MSNHALTVTPKGLLDFLLHIAPVRTPFIWGPPGIGKSAIVQQFADQVGLECVSLLGSQLAPEDLIGVPQILNGVSRFCPPRMIARPEPYCLFLDELNACSQEVQKAFYSLIHDRRIAEYRLPKGSIVIAAGNRAQDSAITRVMSSALLNRMVHIHLSVSSSEWLEWAYQSKIHPWIIDYIRLRPDHLWSDPPKNETPFSTPRAYEMLSNVLCEYGEEVTDETLAILTQGCLSPEHAGQFRSFVRQIRHRYRLEDIIEGSVNWPRDASERDVLYFLAQSLRSRLIKELPPKKEDMNSEIRELLHKVKGRLSDLAIISLEIAQMIADPNSGNENGAKLPDWFLLDLIRDIPRIAKNRK